MQSRSQSAPPECSNHKQIFSNHKFKLKPPTSVTLLHRKLGLLCLPVCGLSADRDFIDGYFLISKPSIWSMIWDEHTKKMSYILIRSSQWFLTNKFWVFTPSLFALPKAVLCWLSLWNSERVFIQILIVMSSSKHFHGTLCHYLLPSNYSVLYYNSANWFWHAQFVDK